MCVETPSGETGMRHTFGYEGRRWEAYLYFQGWDNLSLGLHFNWRVPNVEIHLPFSFIRVGRQGHWMHLNDLPKTICRCTDWKHGFPI